MVQYWVSQARTIDTMEEPGEGEPAQLASPALLGTPVDAEHTDPALETSSSASPRERGEDFIG
jgi:hypothetical protein